MRIFLLVCIALLLSSAPLQASDSYGPHITAYPREPFRTLATDELTVFVVDVYSTSPDREVARVEVRGTPNLAVIGVLWSHDGAPRCDLFPGGGGLWCEYTTKLGSPLELDVLVAPRAPATWPEACAGYVGLTVTATAGGHTATHTRARLPRRDQGCAYLPLVRTP